MSNAFALVAIALLTLAQGCTSLPPRPSGDAKLAAAPLIPAHVANASFSADTLYALLAAEMAIDRRRYDIALSNYVEHAQQTQDSGVAKRATQIARILRAHPQTLAMAELWYQLEPEDNEAAAILLEELVHVRDFLPATDLASKLAKSGEDVSFDTIAFSSVQNGRDIVDALLPRYATLDKDFPNNAKIKLGYSVLLQASQQYKHALDVLHSIPQQQQDDLKIRYQEIRLLEQTGNSKEALKKLTALTEQHPDNVALRTRYARALWKTNPQQARKEIQSLHDEQPGDAEILYYYALLEQEAGNLEQASLLYTDLIGLGHYNNEAHFNLGDIYSAQNKPKQALTHYQLVDESNIALAATVKAAEILVSLDQQDDAIAWIKQRQHVLPSQYRPGFIMLESDIHARSGKMRQAEASLSKGIQQFPGNIELVYARALLFSRINMLAEAEADFKQIIAVAPNHAASLNALGYTLADQTDRLIEARGFIERALTLEPDDPAILDSMGWLQYRLGNIKDALVHLRRAFKLQLDHEIAAHLGEVLWVEGRRDEAREVWRKGAEHNPDSEVLRRTLKRFNLRIDDI